MYYLVLVAYVIQVQKVYTEYGDHCTRTSTVQVLVLYLYIQFQYICGKDEPANMKNNSISRINLYSIIIVHRRTVHTSTTHRYIRDRVCADTESTTVCIYHLQSQGLKFSTETVHTVTQIYSH